MSNTHATKMIPGADIGHQAVVETDQAQKTLERFYRRWNNTKIKLNATMAIEGIKAAKTLEDYRASFTGTSKELAAAFEDMHRKAQLLFEDTELMFDGQKLKGIDQILDSLSSVDISNLKEANFEIEKLEEGAKKADQAIRQIGKEKKQAKKKSIEILDDEKIKKKISYIKNQINSIMSESYSIDVELNEDSIKEAEEKIRKLQKKLNRARNNLADISVRDADSESHNILFAQMNTMIKNTSSVLDDFLDRINEKAKMVLDSGEKIVEEIVDIDAFQDAILGTEEAETKEIKKQTKARKEQTKAIKEQQKALKESEKIDRSKTFNQLVNEEQAKMLKKMGVESYYPGITSTIEKASEQMDLISDILSSITDEFNLVELNQPLAILDDYKGEHISSKQKFQEIIKRKWKEGKKSQAAKLFEAYQTKFPDGGFDPAKLKLFGKDWEKNHLKYLSQANVEIELVEEKLKSNFETYAKVWFPDLLKDEIRNYSNYYTEALVDTRNYIKLLLQQKQIQEEIARKTNGLNEIELQKNLNALVKEYNRLEEKRKYYYLEKERLASVVSNGKLKEEPWYGKESVVHRQNEVGAKMSSYAEKAQRLLIPIKTIFEKLQNMGIDASESIFGDISKELSGNKEYFTKDRFLINPLHLDESYINLFPSLEEAFKDVSERIESFGTRISKKDMKFEVPLKRFEEIDKAYPNLDKLLPIISSYSNREVELAVSQFIEEINKTKDLTMANQNGVYYGEEGSFRLLDDFASKLKGLITSVDDSKYAMQRFDEEILRPIYKNNNFNLDGSSQLLLKIISTKKEKDFFTSSFRDLIPEGLNWDSEMESEISSILDNFKNIEGYTGVQALKEFEGFVNSWKLKFIEQKKELESEADFIDQMTDSSQQEKDKLIKERKLINDTAFLNEHVEGLIRESDNLKQLFDNFNIPKEARGYISDLIIDQMTAIVANSSSDVNLPYDLIQEEIISQILKNGTAELGSEISEIYSEFKNAIKGVKLYIPDSLKDEYDPKDWNDIRSKNQRFFTRKRTPGSSQIDTFYDELWEARDGFFRPILVDENGNKIEQELDAGHKLIELIDYVRTLRKKDFEHPYRELNKNKVPENEDYENVGGSVVVAISNLYSEIENHAKFLQEQRERIAQADMENIQKSTKKEKVIEDNGFSSFNISTEEGLKALRDAIIKDPNSLFDFSKVMSTLDLNEVLAKGFATIYSGDGIEWKVAEVGARSFNEDETIATLKLINKEFGLILDQQYKLIKHENPVSDESGKEVEVESTSFDLVSSRGIYSPIAVEKVMKDLESRQFANERWLNERINRLNNLESQYTRSSKKVDQSAKLRHPEATSLEDPEATIQDLFSNLRNTLTSTLDSVKNGGAELSEQVKTDIEKNLKAYKTEAENEYRETHTSTTMSATDIETARQQYLSKVSGLEANAKRQNIYQELEGSFQEIRRELDGIVTDAIEQKDFQKIINQYRALSSSVTAKTSEKQLDTSKFAELLKLTTALEDASYRYSKNIKKGIDASAAGKEKEDIQKQIEKLKQEYFKDGVSEAQQLELDKIHNKYYELELENKRNQEIKDQKKAEDRIKAIQELNNQMRNSEVEIDTMKKKLESFDGSLDGYEQATESIKNMTEAQKEFNQATELEDKKKASDNYSNFKKDYQAQVEWMRSQKQAAKNNPEPLTGLDATYDKLSKLLPKINEINGAIEEAQSKDKGSGTYSNYIENLQKKGQILKTELYKVLQTIDLNSPKMEMNLPKYFSGNDSILHFLAQLTLKGSEAQGQVDDLMFSLNKGISIDAKTESRMFEIFKNARNMYSDLSSFKNLDDSEGTIVGNLKKTLLKIGEEQKKEFDLGIWGPEQEKELRRQLDFIDKYGKHVISAAKYENEYFSNKRLYKDGETINVFKEEEKELEKSSNSMKKKLQEYAKTTTEFEDGQLIFKKFGTDAHGISKLDFSVFDEATGKIRNFRMEMGALSKTPSFEEILPNNIESFNNKAVSQLEKLNSILNFEGIDKKSNIYQNALEAQKVLANLASQDTAADPGKMSEAIRNAQISYAQLDKLYKKHLEYQSMIEQGQGAFVGDSFDPKKSAFDQATNALKAYQEQMNYTLVTTKKFDNTNKVLKATFKDQEGMLHDVSISLDGFSNQFAAIEKGLSKPMGFFDTLTNGLTKTAKQMFNAFVGYNVFYKVVGEIKKGYQYVKQIDLAMTELKKVTDESESSYANFLKTTAKTAGDIGSTISDFTNATADFARLGYTLEESSEMAKSAIVYKNVADGINSVDESTKSIISTIKAFGMESSDSMMIVDKFNEVGNKFAITSAGIGTALQKSASALYSAGNDIDESIALVTAANSVIQNPEIVGTALKTLSLRIRGAKVELEDAGLETDNMATSVSKLQEKILGLTHGKVDIMQDENTFKSTIQILREMSKAWGIMTDIEQAGALELLGGKRQANILSSIITNFNTVEDVLKVSQNSEGSAIKENEKYLDSIQGKTDQLKNSMQTLWNHTIDSSQIKTLIDMFNSLVKAADKVGLLNVAFGSIMGMTSVKSKINIFDKKSWETAFAGADTFSGKVKGIASSFGLVEKAGTLVTGLISGAISMIASWGISVLISLLIKGIGEMYDTTEELIGKWEESKAKLNDLNSELDKTKERISELESKGTLNFIDKKELEQLRLQNYELERRIKLTKEQGDSTKSQIQEKIRKKYKRNDDFFNFTQDFGNANVPIERQTHYKNEVDSLIGFIEEQRKIIYDESGKLRDDISEQTIENVLSNIESGKKNLLDKATEIYNDLDEYGPDVSDEFTKILYSQIDDIDKAIDPISYYKDKINNILKDNVQEKNKLYEILKSGDVKGSDISDNLKNDLKEAEITVDEFVGYINSLKTNGKEELLEPKFNMKDFDSQIDDVQSKVEKYKSILSSLESGDFSYSDFIDLIQEFPELAEGVDSSSESFDGLASNLKKAIKESPVDLINNLKSLSNQLKIMGKSTDEIDQLINSLENINVEPVNSLSNSYETLKDKINGAKQAQTELEQSMQKETSGYETRNKALAEMEKYLNRGEIGSGSQLWNIAEEYGYSYDTSKTLEENAYALENLVKVEKEYYKLNKDGQADFEGTANFIKDVESALKELGGLEGVQWEYNNGNPIIDFDNADFDVILSALQKTEKFANLTEESFTDMLTQISKWFEFDWEDQDDQMDFFLKSQQKKQQQKLNELTNGNFDYTKVHYKISEEMGKAGWDNGGGTSTTFDQGTTVMDSDGNEHQLVMSVIDNDGNILTPEAFGDYVSNVLEGAENILEADKVENGGKGLIINDFLGSPEDLDSYFEEFNSKIQRYKDLDLQLHELATKGTTSTGEPVSIYSNEIAEMFGVSGKQLDMLISSFKEKYGDAINVINDPNGLIQAFENSGGKLTEKSVSSLKELVSSFEVSGETDTTFINFEELRKAGKEAGYTKEQIDDLIETIKNENNVVDLKLTKGDPLGLQSMQNNTKSLIDYLTILGIKAKEITETEDATGPKVDIDIPSFASSMAAEGWTAEQIQSYMSTLVGSGTALFTLDGTTVDVNSEDVLSKINEAIANTPITAENNINVPFEVTGNGLGTIDTIIAKISEIPQAASTTYTIHENTIKTTTFTPPKYSGAGVFTGNAFASGSGSIGANKTEQSLVGELGQELVVRGNRWFTVGDNGAEFTDVHKGDIIFNHKQTKELLENGASKSRGKAYASGTAYSHASGFDDYWNSKRGQSGNGHSTSKSNAEKTAEEFLEIFDWIEIRLEEINEKLDLQEATLDNTIGFVNKNLLVDEMIEVSKVLKENLISGIQEYEKYSDTLLSKIPEAYREAAKNGKISIESFEGKTDEETLKAIKEYREWAEKADDLKQELEETKQKIAELAKQKFDNIKDDFDDMISKLENQNDLFDSQMSLIEETGNVASKKYYEQMISNSKEQIKLLTEQRKRLNDTLNEQIALGNIEVGSEQWKEMVEEIQDVDKEIIDTTTDIEGFQNAINEIYWTNFDNLINRLDYLQNETQNLIDLMQNKDLLDIPEIETGWSKDDVKWTEKGLAALGLYAQQMEIAEKKSQEYGKAIDDLNKDYKEGKYSETEYLEKLNELKDGQYEAIQNYYDAQEAIKDLQATRIDAIKNGIDKEIDAYSKLINKQKEALSEEKDMNDFQKNIKNKEDEISKIERRLNSMAGDSSLSAIAERRKLEEELNKLRKELDDEYYDRSVEDKQNALDKELESFEEEKEKEKESLDKYLEDIDSVMKDSLELVKQNANNIFETIKKTSEEYGLTVSDSITMPWKDGETAVSGYQEKFNTAMSSTMDQLKLLKEEWQNIIDKMMEAAEVDIILKNNQFNDLTQNTRTMSIDDLGEELTINPGENGSLNYLAKNARTMSKSIEKIEKLDLTSALANSKQSIGVSSSVQPVENNINLTLDIAEVVHVDHVDKENLKDLSQIVEKQLDSYMRDLNNNLRKYSR